ncbi:MAG: hypothetical protein ACE5DX_03230 [Candidatus Dojkabacteria bacterium]
MESLKTLPPPSNPDFGKTAPLPRLYDTTEPPDALKTDANLMLTRSLYRTLSEPNPRNGRLTANNVTLIQDLIADMLPRSRVGEVLIPRESYPNLPFLQVTDANLDPDRLHRFLKRRIMRNFYSKVGGDGLTISLLGPREFTQNRIDEVGRQRAKVFGLKRGWDIPTVSGRDVDTGDLTSIHIIIDAPDHLTGEAVHAGSMRILIPEKPQPGESVAQIIDNFQYLATTDVNSGKKDELSVTEALKRYVQIPSNAAIRSAILAGKLISWERLVGGDFKRIVGEMNDYTYPHLAILSLIMLTTGAFLKSRGLRFVLLQTDEANLPWIQINFSNAYQVFNTHTSKKADGTDDVTFDLILDLEEGHQHLTDLQRTFAEEMLTQFTN